MIARIVRLLVLIAIIPLLILVGCQSKLIYFPRPYRDGITADWQQESGGKFIDFTTSQGRQRAFLQGNLKSPRSLWILCGGNGTVALDWAGWIARNAPNEDAWLLMDFPGYGDCEGKPSPGGILENIRTAVTLAWQETGESGNPDPTRLRFFGHSLGAAATLLAATEFKIQRGVLLTPFTSTMEMSRAMTGLPLGFLVWHRFDNDKCLTQLADRGPGEVIIFHGDDDEAIPVTMSRQLAAEHKSIVRLTEIPGGRHNTLQDTNTPEIADALRKIGER